MSYKDFYFPRLSRRNRYSRFRYYNQYRQEIRFDCLGRCVYCDAHENEIGGELYMTLDHFRPKDKYPNLTHKPSNLLWSCTVCNNFKKNFWPAYGTQYTINGDQGFIDPFNESMLEYFDILPNGKMVALKPPAQWMIDLLKLNRYGAKKIRESRNQKYERKQKLELYFQAAIKDTLTLIENNEISPKNREKLSNHLEDLKQAYKISIESCDPDFQIH